MVPSIPKKGGETNHKWVAQLDDLATKWLQDHNSVKEVLLFCEILKNFGLHSLC